MTRLKQVLLIVLGLGLAGAMVALGFCSLGVVDRKLPEAERHHGAG